MLNLNLSSDVPQPHYMQLYTQIREQIRNGSIPHGSRLPSIRSLQLHLNISKSTIETAYQILLTEGYALSKPRSGLFVANPLGIKPFCALPEVPHATSEYLLAPSLHVPDAHLIDFRPSAIDQQIFPIQNWKKALHRAIEQHHSQLCTYGDPQGEYSFRSTVSEYLRISRGVVCSPEQIVIGSGIQYSIGILAKLLTNINHLAFEEPGYVPVREHFKQYGYQVTPISVLDNGISLDELENSDAQAVYVTPSHQFPTGSVLSYPERERLLHWARTKDAYIIEDDYDGEFRYSIKPIPSLQGLDQGGRVIYLGTFSKAFTPALRMNYMVLPVELVDKMKRIQYLFDGPSRIDQWAMQSFMDQGHWYRHIRRMRKVYGKKHHRFIALIHSLMGEHVRISGHNAGLHIRLTVKTRQTSDTLIKLAAEAGVRVYDLHEMWSKPTKLEYPHIYLGFAGMNEIEMDKGVHLLNKAWGDIFIP